MQTVPERTLSKVQEIQKHMGKNYENLTIGSASADELVLPGWSPPDPPKQCLETVDGMALRCSQ